LAGMAPAPMEECILGLPQQHRMPADAFNLWWVRGEKELGLQFPLLESIDEFPFGFFKMKKGLHPGPGRCQQFFGGWFLPLDEHRMQLVTHLRRGEGLESIPGIGVEGMG